MLRKRHIIFLILLFWMSKLSLSGQEIILSKPQKIPTKVTEFEIIGQTEEGLLIHKFGPRFNQVECFNPEDMSLRWARELPLKGRRFFIMEIVKAGNELLVFYYNKEGRYYNVYVRKMDSKLKMIKSDVLLMRTRRKFGQQIFNFHLDYDLSQSYFVVQKRYRNSIGVTRLECIWVDRSLEVIDRRDVDIIKPEWQFKQLLVRKDGTLFLVQSHIKKAVFSNTQLSDAIYIDAFYPFSKTSKKAKIPLDGEYLTSDVNAQWDVFNDQLVVAGFYNRKQSTDLAGYYFFRADFSKETPIVSPQVYTSFDKELIGKIVGKNAFTSLDRLRNMEMRKLILRSDGGALLVGEIHDTESSSTARPFIFDERGLGRNNNVILQYIYKDVALFSVDSNGKTDWIELLKKSQYSENDQGYFSSVGVMNTRYSINLLFNEYLNRRNTLNSYTLDSKGNGVTSSLFDSSGYKVTLAPRYAKQISPTEIIVPTFNYRNEFLLAKIQF